MNKLIAFHGKQSVKDFYIERVRAHAAADEIIHGKYWENGKGCAVGCTIHSRTHARYETELGIPLALARLEDNRTYRVFVQADRPFRMNAGDLHSYYVRSDSGQMVPLDNLVTVQESAGPPVITHYNLFRAVEIDGSAAPGASSGTAIDSMEKLATSNMMRGMGFEWTGLTLDEIESSGKALLIFGLGILVVYLTLSAQYESFALPFIILLAVSG